MAFEYSLAKFIPFRDEAACARVRAITRSELTKHSNPDFKKRTWILNGDDRLWTTNSGW